MADVKEIKMYSDFKSPYAWIAFDPAYALEEKFKVKLVSELSRMPKAKFRYTLIEIRFVQMKIKAFTMTCSKSG